MVQAVEAVGNNGRREAAEEGGEIVGEKQNAASDSERRRQWKITVMVRVRGGDGREQWGERKRGKWGSRGEEWF
jgi:hypothetical protein